MIYEKVVVTGLLNKRCTGIYALTSDMWNEVENLFTEEGWQDERRMEVLRRNNFFNVVSVSTGVRIEQNILFLYPFF